MSDDQDLANWQQPARQKPEQHKCEKHQFQSYRRECPTCEVEKLKASNAGLVEGFTETDNQRLETIAELREINAELLKALNRVYEYAKPKSYSRSVHERHIGERLLEIVDGPIERAKQ